MNDSTNDNPDKEQNKESIPVLNEIIAPGELQDVDEIENREPESYQPVSTQIEEALGPGVYESLIENITNEVQKDIAERVRHSLNELIEEILENTMEHCEETIQNIVLSQLQENLPEILAKSLRKTEENED